MLSVGSLCFGILLSKVTFTCFFLQVLYELSPRAVNSTTEAIGDEVKRALGRSGKRNGIIVCLSVTMGACISFMKMKVSGLCPKQKPEGWLAK